MGSHRVTGRITLTIFIARAEPHLVIYIRNLQLTAVTHCLLIATHFTDPQKDDSLCQARECHRELNSRRAEASVLPITTQPPALVIDWRFRRI